MQMPCWHAYAPLHSMYIMDGPVEAISQPGSVGDRVRGSTEWKGAKVHEKSVIISYAEQEQRTIVLISSNHLFPCFFFWNLKILTGYCVSGVLNGLNL